MLLKTQAIQKSDGHQRRPKPTGRSNVHRHAYYAGAARGFSRPAKGLGAGRHALGWELPGKCVGTRYWLQSPPPELISGLCAWKSLGQEKGGLPFRATPGHGWAGFMIYAPNIKLITGGRQGYESTGGGSLCRKEGPTAGKKLAVTQAKKASRDHIRNTSRVRGDPDGPCKAAQRLTPSGYCTCVD
jgi:hypothetical protein